MRVAELLMSDPSDGRPLAAIARSSGAGRRMIERVFVDSTGMAFGRWRQPLRLMHAMRLRRAGAKVTHAALEVGCSTPSAFVTAFRRALGTTPTR
jgi:AraC-like DNA-binding protein